MLRTSSDRASRSRSSSNPLSQSDLHPVSRPREIAGLVAAACGVFSLGAAHANPTDPKVANGSASFSQSGNSLVVRNTPGTIINWRGFSIAPGEITDFIQQSSSSTVLNRVIGVDPSLILGTLESNGRVFLINPNGMVFGRGATVNTAGLVATTLDLSDASFKSGSYAFTGAAAGAISNAGAIESSSGDVYLIAPNITNSGTITARSGNVVLAAGQSVEIVGRGLDDVHFEVASKSNSAVNLGSLSGDAVGVFAGTIDQNGAASANSVAVSGGRVVLSALGDVGLGAGSSTTANGATAGGSIAISSASGSLTVAPGALVAASGTTGGAVSLVAATGSESLGGTIDVSGTRSGGSVEILGSQVGVAGTALIDASGGAQGGTIYVGGGPGGRDAAVMNAQSTVIDTGAVLDADAKGFGNGGHIVTFGSTSNSVLGTLEAQAGTLGGAGGLIETSGQGSLSVANAPLIAPRGLGHGGTWLIDPTDVTISSAADSNESGTFTPSGNTANINVNTLETAVNNGGSVVIQTESAGTGTGNITVANALNFAPSSAATLTMNAVGSIDVAANIHVTNSTPVNMALNANTNVGAITIGSNVSIETGGGNFTANSASFNSTGYVTNANASGTYSTGAISITTTNGGLTSSALSSAGNMTLHVSSGQTLDQTSYFQSGMNNQPATLSVTTDNYSSSNTYVDLEAYHTGGRLNIQTTSPGRDIVVTIETYPDGADSQYPNALVLNASMIGDSPMTTIGNANTSRIDFLTQSQYLNCCNGVSAYDTLNLNAKTITQDANTNITASALNLTGNQINLQGLVPYSGPMSITATGTGSNPTLTLGGAGGNTLLVVSPNPYTGVQGISGFPTINVSYADLQVQSSITSSGTLTINSTNAPATNPSISIGGISSSAPASISSSGDLVINTTSNISLFGGSTPGASAVIDPPNVTINAGSLSLVGGSAAGAYAAITSPGNVILNVTGPITFNSAGAASAVIVAPQGTVTGCNGCTSLTDNPLVSGAIEVGFYQGPPVVTPVQPPPSTPNPVAGILGNENTNEQDTTLNDLVFTGGPGDLGIAIWVIDQLCGSNS